MLSEALQLDIPQILHDNPALEVSLYEHEHELHIEHQNIRSLP